MEDKLIQTKGYSIVVTDEAFGFLQDIKGKENKHESEIGLMNQLFDGKGDKTTLARNRERAVPQNSTSMCLGVQPQSFFKTLQSIGKTTWQDSGFAERFLFSSVKPYRLVIKSYWKYFCFVLLC